MAKIEIRNLNKSYYIGKEEYKILKDLNLKLESSQFVAVYGKSGSGKSTLMNVIGGLDEYQTGKILIDGKEIKSFSNNNLDYYRNKSIGFIFQEYNLLENLKVIDNVILPMSISGLSSKECKSRALELLTKVGLENQKNMRASQLSGGQKQRVAIARALANDPDIILADEPTGALDSKTSAEILELLKSISEEGKLIVAITHSKEVTKYASKVITLKDGIIESENNDSSDEIEIDTTKVKNKVSLKLSRAFKIARANLLSKKFRTTLVALGLSLGITGSIVVTSISDEMIKDTEGMFSSMQTDETIVNVAVFNEDYQASIDDDYIEEQITAVETYIENLEGANAVYENKMLSYIEIEKSEYEDENGELVEEKFEYENPFITLDYGDTNNFKLKYGKYPSKANEIYFTGSINEIDQFLSDTGSDTKITEDEYMRFENKPGTEVYAKLEAIIEDEIVGKTVEFEASDGKILEFKIVGATELSEYSMQYTYYKMPYNMNKEIIEQYGTTWGFDYYVEFDTVAQAEKFIEDNSSLSAQIDSITSGSYGIETGYKDYRIDVIDNRSMMKIVNNLINLVRNVFLSLICVSFAVSVIMVNLIIYISTLERKIEIGTLRAIGAGKRDIRNIFVLEGIMIGIVGFIISLVTSLIGVLFVNLLWYYLNGGYTEFFYFGISVPYLLLIALVIIILMIISSLAPAISASRQNPIDALREE